MEAATAADDMDALKAAIAAAVAVGLGHTKLLPSGRGATAVKKAKARAFGAGSAAVMPKKKGGKKKGGKKLGIGKK